jgi:transcriptional regulator with XRE-family HTH domain
LIRAATIGIEAMRRNKSTGPNKSNTFDLSIAYEEGLDYLGGASIRDVAALSGLGRETVHQISRNKGDPKLSTLIAIADAFDLTVVQFLELATVPEVESGN